MPGYPCCCVPTIDCDDYDTVPNPFDVTPSFTVAGMTNSDTATCTSINLTYSNLLFFSRDILPESSGLCGVLFTWLLNFPSGSVSCFIGGSWFVYNVSFVRIGFRIYHHIADPSTILYDVTATVSAAPGSVIIFSSSENVFTGNLNSPWDEMDGMILTIDAISSGCCEENGSSATATISTGTGGAAGVGAYVVDDQLTGRFVVDQFGRRVFTP
jgi:hypothetical protein